ncbi:type II secretion system F family protein [Streptomyces sp. CAU 1734]|uniref:type II secretion system F family protein n=1 Tax=Streptomyces sp. CAU 1734 TaxID=3140360 RepID=UPI0032616F6A
MVGSAGAGIRARRVRGRGERLLAVEREPRRRWAPLAARAGVWAAPAGAVITCWVLVEGIPGLALGLAAAFGVRRWRRTRPGGAAADPAVERELPLAADLLAACLTAGAGPREAAEAVGDSLGGRVGAGLTQAAAELRLGGEPARAWDSFARLPGAAELARCLERADCAGAPAAEPVSRLARRLRDTRARASAARGRRAQVLVTAPVGLCFLPAFLSVGVAPVVIGLAGGLLHGN